MFTVPCRVLRPASKQPRGNNCGVESLNFKIAALRIEELSAEQVVALSAVCRPL